MIKTMIFDLGKVIVPFEIEKGLTQFEKISGLTRDQFQGEIFGTEASRLFETGRISAVEFFETFRDSLGVKIRFEDFVTSWNSIFLSEPIISVSLLSRLSSKYRLLILSDTNELHFEFIRQNFSVLELFDDFVLSYEVGEMKPARSVFETAVEKAGCPANQCFFTDDKKENVQKARELGIRGVHFRSARQFEGYLKRAEII